MREEKEMSEGEKVQKELERNGAEIIERERREMRTREIETI